MVVVEKLVHVKLFIDKQNNKVMFAEGDEDFVEILFSSLTLPLGTIVELLTKHAELKIQKLKA